MTIPTPPQHQVGRRDAAWRLRPGDATRGSEAGPKDQQVWVTRSWPGTGAAPRTGRSKRSTNVVKRVNRVSV